VIPVERFDPVARRILDQYIPNANMAGNFFQVTEPNPLDSNEVTGKVDHSISDMNRLTASYYWNRGQEIEGLSGTLPWSRRQFNWQQQNVNVGDTWTVSATTINDLRLTYMRNFGGRLNTPEMSLGDLGSAYQIQGQPSLPQIAVSGYFTLGQAIAGPVAGSNYYGIRELLSINRGSHSLKLGGDFSLEKFIHDTTLNNYGVFNFDASKTGNALADFLLGVPVTMNQDTPITKIDNGWYSGLFIQDDWRIHPRFTLNLGLRYDYQTPVTDPHDRKLTFIEGRQSTVVPNAPLGLLFPGDEGIPRSIINPDRNNFAPRVGFAWDPKATDGPPCEEPSACFMAASLETSSTRRQTGSRLQSVNGSTTWHRWRTPTDCSRVDNRPFRIPTRRRTRALFSRRVWPAPVWIFAGRTRTSSTSPCSAS
jgi:outer membrane receptor protein involved in Fe transport